MSITPLANANFINQNAPVVSSVNANHQARFDMQNALASQAISDEKNEISEVRPAEETYKVDPEHEHEKNKQDEQMTENNDKEKNENSNQNNENNDLSDDFNEHSHIDIII